MVIYEVQVDAEYFVIVGDEEDWDLREIGVYKVEADSDDEARERAIELAIKDDPHHGNEYRYVTWILNNMALSTKKSFNDMVKSIRKGWTRYIDPNTGEEIFTPGRDDEASAFDYSQPEPKQYPAKEREEGSRQIGDITIYYDFITSYDTTDGYITGQYIEVKSMDTPLGHTDEVRNAKGFASHIFDFDEGHQVRISIKIDEDTIDEFYSPRYSFFKRGTELWTLGSNGYSIEAKSYDELLSYIERKDELLKDRDYDDEYDEFVNNLPDRIEQNGYDMYFNCADSDFITYLNNGDCNIELTIFPNEDVYTGYFTIEEYDVQCMSWELVSEGDYISPVDLIGRVKDKLNDMPRGS